MYANLQLCAGKCNFSYNRWFEWVFIRASNCIFWYSEEEVSCISYHLIIVNSNVRWLQKRRFNFDIIIIIPDTFITSNDFFFQDALLSSSCSSQRRQWSISNTPHESTIRKWSVGSGDRRRQPPFQWISKKRRKDWPQESLKLWYFYV